MPTVRYLSMKIILAGSLLVLAACGSNASSTATSSASVAASASSAPKSDRTTFEVIRMADEVDLFPQENIDLPSGGSLLNERVPVGTERKVIPKELVDQICGAKAEGQPPIQCDKVGDETSVNVPVGAAHDYLRVIAAGEESVERAIERSKPLLAKQALPAGAHVMFGTLFELDDKTKKNVAVGFRTYVVSGDPILTEKDIEAAGSDTTHGAASITISLKPDAAARFEKFTGENVMRRLALVIDGNVLSAPVLQSKIAGGKLSVALTAADKSTDADKEEAARLAKALNPH